MYYFYSACNWTLDFICLPAAIITEWALIDNHFLLEHIQLCEREILLVLVNLYLSPLKQVVLLRLQLMTKELKTKAFVVQCTTKQF